MSKVDGEYLQDLGRRVVVARKSRGWNQQALAKESKMSDATVRKVEKGVEVSPAYLRAVLDTLEMPPPGEDPALVFPPDIEGARTLVGMHLLSMSPDERLERIHELTRFLMDRWRASHAE